MFGIQPVHLLIIAIVAFIIFGPKHLPTIGRSIAKAFRDLRTGMKDMGEGFHEEYDKTPPAPAVYPPAPADTIAASTPATDTQPPAGPFCVQCGAANPPDSKFCHKCGREFGDNKG